MIKDAFYLKRIVIVLMMKFIYCELRYHYTNDDIFIYFDEVSVYLSVTTNYRPALA